MTLTIIIRKTFVLFLFAFLVVIVLQCCNLSEVQAFAPSRRTIWSSQQHLHPPGRRRRRRQQQNTEQAQRQKQRYESQYLQPSQRPQNRPKTALSMALIPLSGDEVGGLISVDTTPTAAQYASYWGRTPQERYNRLVETLLVSLLGMIFSYCLSFVVGGFVATLLGSVFLFWGIFTPQFQAIQRNWEFLGGRPLLDYTTAITNLDTDDDTNDDDGLQGWLDRRRRGRNTDYGLYGALFVGYLRDYCVVEYSEAAPVEEEYDLVDFTDYTMETDELERYTGNPYLLRVRLADSQGRQLQVHTRLSEEYLKFIYAEQEQQQQEEGRRRLGVMALLLSQSREFNQLAALSDIYVPAVQTYIGDYPYLHRDGIEYLLATDDDIWETLEQEERAGVIKPRRMVPALKPSSTVEKDDPVQTKRSKRKPPPRNETEEGEANWYDGSNEEESISSATTRKTKKKKSSSRWTPSSSSTDSGTTKTTSSSAASFYYDDEVEEDDYYDDDDEADWTRKAKVPVQRRGRGRSPRRRIRDA